MPLTYFSVIRYVPDPVREEQINIGIIAISPDDKFGMVKFTEDFDRARRVGNENVQFLKDFAEYLKNQMPKQPSLFLSEFLIAENLKKIAINWQNSIQFSEPKISQLSVEQVIDRESKRFIPSPVKREIMIPKRRIIGRAKGYLTAALKVRFKQPKMIQQILRTNEIIEGKRDVYVLPLVIKNEHPYLGASALSFDIFDIHKLMEEIRATAWIIEDVKTLQKELPLAILAQPPKPDVGTGVKEIYEKWKCIYTELGSEFIEENRIEKWALQVVEKLPILIN